MSSATSSANRDIIDGRIKKKGDKYKESESKLPKIEYSRKRSAIPFDKKEHDETSISSACSSSDSDAENSSDFDEEEIETLDKKLVEEAETMKSHYNFLKKLLNQSQIKDVEENLIEVKSGTAMEYIERLQKLQDEMNSRIKKATELRTFKLKNIQHKHKAGEQAIRQNFENDKEILYDTMKGNLEEQVQRLEDERIEADFNASLLSGRNLRISGCGRGRRPYDPVQHKKKKRPAIVKGPCIVHQLHEHEQFEDRKIIEKFPIGLKRKEDAEKLNKKKP